MDGVDTTVVEGIDWAGLTARMAQGLTTEEDARIVAQLVRDQQELLKGVHLLAQGAMRALERGVWPEALAGLERLAGIV